MSSMNAGRSATSARRSTASSARGRRRPSRLSGPQSTSQPDGLLLAGRGDLADRPHGQPHQRRAEPGVAAGQVEVQHVLDGHEVAAISQHVIEFGAEPQPALDATSKITPAGTRSKSCSLTMNINSCDDSIERGASTSDRTGRRGTVASAQPESEPTRLDADRTGQHMTVMVDGSASAPPCTATCTSPARRARRELHDQQGRRGRARCRAGAGPQWWWGVTCAGALY